MYVVYSIYVLGAFKKEVKEICNMILNDSVGQAAWNKLTCNVEQT